MNLLARLAWYFLVAFSHLPFWVMHRLSDGAYYLIYYGLGYRKKVVRENLRNSFPEKSAAELLQIEKKFYRNFCDILFETIKTISISREEFRRRFVYQNREVMDGFFEKGINVAGTAGHSCNWEWVAIGMGLEAKQTLYGLYKPLSNAFFNDAMIQNRGRFGTHLLPAASVKKLYEQMVKEPYIVGLFVDQAPHHYPKAIEVKFLNQKTYVVAGPGLMVAQKNMALIFGWVKRTGRSQYNWGIDVLEPRMPAGGLRPEDIAQIEHIAIQHQITRAQAETVLLATQSFCARLEAQIKMAPQDWLWSHRRWKNR